jgi:hypothetical protein
MREAARDERRQDLAVGRDLRGQAQPLGVAQVGVVVDVAVDRGDDVGLAGRHELLAVQRVGVGLGDRTDARPAGVAEDGHDDIRTGKSAVQQGICRDRGTQRVRVVAELADLGRNLVHEAQVSARSADGHRPEQLIRARREGRVDVGLVQGDAVAADEDVQAGGVASAHLEPVERRERHLDRPVRGDRRGGLADGTLRQLGHSAGGGRAVAAERPHDVLEPDEDRVAGLQLIAGPDHLAGVERRFEVRQQGVERCCALFECEHVREPRAGEQRHRPERAAQRAVERLELIGDRRQITGIGPRRAGA